jgi:hypothetical protein
VQLFLTSLRGIRSGIGCMHSNRLDGSKYIHCLHECNSNPHFGQVSGVSPRLGRIVPHCEQRDTVRLAGICSGRGPNVSFRAGFSPDRCCGLSPLSWYPCCRYFRSDISPCLPGTLSRYSPRASRAARNACLRTDPPHLHLYPDRSQLFFRGTGATISG